jgi:hypothetical protein
MPVRVSTPSYFTSVSMVTNIVGFDKSYLLRTIRPVAHQPRHTIRLVGEVLSEDGVDEFGTVVFEEVLEV